MLNKQTTMSKRKNDNTKITKFFVKKSKPTNKNDSVAEDPEYEKLKQDVIDLKERLLKLSQEKLKLEASLLPAPVKLKDIPINYVRTDQVRNNTWGIFTKKKQLKFHELGGMVVSKNDGKKLIVNFTAFSGNTVHKYAVKLNVDEQGKYSFDKAFVPPSIKIKQLIKKYHLNNLENVRKFLSIIATNCQVFHDIEDQINNLKNNVEKNNINIVNSFDNRYVLLQLPLIYVNTKEIFNVQVHLEYGLEIPRPVKLVITAAGMPDKYLLILKKQFRNFKKYDLLNAFEISVRQDLNDEKSAFHWLKNRFTDVFETSVLTMEAHNKSSVSQQFKIEKRSTVIEKSDKNQSKSDESLSSESEYEPKKVTPIQSTMVTRKTSQKFKTLLSSQSNSSHIEMTTNNTKNVKLSSQKVKSPQKTLTSQNNLSSTKKNVKTSNPNKINENKKLTEKENFGKDDDADTIILKKDKSRNFSYLELINKAERKNKTLNQNKVNPGKIKINESNTSKKLSMKSPADSSSKKIQQDEKNSPDSGAKVSVLRTSNKRTQSVSIQKTPSPQKQIKLSTKTDKNSIPTKISTRQNFKKQNVDSNVKTRSMKKTEQTKPKKAPKRPKKPKVTRK